MPLNFTQALKFLFQQEIEILCEADTLLVAYHRPVRGGTGKRRSSVHQRWAAGPRFKGKLESILKPSAVMVTW